MMERVHGRGKHMGKGRKFEKYRRSFERIQREDECGGQETRKIDMAEERDFRRGELPGKFMAKILYGQNDRKFEEEYLKKLERNWRRWKIVSPEKKP